MIEKSRLEELIEQGATIYSYSGWGSIFETKLYSNHFVGIADDRVSLMQRYNNYEQDLVDYIDDLYETKEEAEWQAEFGCIERVERFDPPYKLADDEVFYFTSKKGAKMSVRKSWNGEWWLCYVGTHRKCDSYVDAIRKAKELFLGGNNE